MIFFVAITLAFHLFWRLGSNWLDSDVHHLLLDEPPTPGHQAGISGILAAITDFTTRQAYLGAAFFNELLLGQAMERLDHLQRFLFRVDDPTAIRIRPLIIDHTCSGLKQFYQAFFLFLLYPGPARHKIWYIPLSVLVMHVVNILRIVALSLAMVYAYSWWDFIHDWVVRPMFYVVLFGLWMVWDQQFANRKNTWSRKVS